MLKLVKFVCFTFCRFPLPSSVWRCLRNRFGLILTHFIPTLFPRYFCMSSPLSCPIHSVVCICLMWHRTYCFLSPIHSCIQFSSLSLAFPMFLLLSLSPFCLIISGSGVSVDTSTPIRASINLQQCLTCVCVSVCACLLVFSVVVFKFSLGMSLL